MRIDEFLDIVEEWQQDIDETEELEVEEWLTDLDIYLTDNNLYTEDTDE